MLSRAIARAATASRQGVLALGARAAANRRAFAAKAAGKEQPPAGDDATAADEPAYKRERRIIISRFSGSKVADAMRADRDKRFEAAPVLLDETSGAFPFPELEVEHLFEQRTESIRSLAGRNTATLVTVSMTQHARKQLEPVHAAFLDTYRLDSLSPADKVPGVGLIDCSYANGWVFALMRSMMLPGLRGSVSAAMRPHSYSRFEASERKTEVRAGAAACLRLHGGRAWRTGRLGSAKDAVLPASIAGHLHVLLRTATAAHCRTLPSFPPPLPPTTPHRRAGILLRRQGSQPHVAVLVLVGPLRNGPVVVSWLMLRRRSRLGTPCGRRATSDFAPEALPDRAPHHALQDALGRVGQRAGGHDSGNQRAAGGAVARLMDDCCPGAPSQPACTGERMKPSCANRCFPRVPLERDREPPHSQPHTPLPHANSFNKRPPLPALPQQPPRAAAPRPALGCRTRLPGRRPGPACGSCRW